MNKKTRRKERAKRALKHRLSIVAVSVVMLLLAVTLFVASSSLKEKRAHQISQEEEYERLIAEEDAYAEELVTLEEASKTDAYKEKIARDKLELVYENEILFKIEP